MTEITSSGRIATEIVDNLRGKVSFAVASGSIDYALAGLPAKVQEKEVSGWEALEKEPTAFNILKGTIFIRHKSLYSDSLEVDLEGTRVSGEATIDFAKQEIDASLLYEPVEATEAAQPQTDPELKKSSEKRVAIKGPWSHPNFFVPVEKSSAAGLTVPGIFQTGWHQQINNR